MTESTKRGNHRSAQIIALTREHQREARQRILCSHYNLRPYNGRACVETTLRRWLNNAFRDEWGRLDRKTRDYRDWVEQRLFELMDHPRLFEQPGTREKVILVEPYRPSPAWHELVNLLETFCNVDYSETPPLHDSRCVSIIVTQRERFGDGIRQHARRRKALV